MMAKTSLPPGFRFHPTDVELVWYYLKRKIMGKSLCFEAIAEVELYKFAPSDLPDKSCLRSRDLEWYFFCPRDRKYSHGSRTNRATETGYWKTTGRDRSVVHNSRTVGMKKTLIFHLGKAPKGSRTDWVMYEFRLESKELVNAGYAQDAFVLCKIFQKGGPGPRNGEQYGAPFREEDWDDDTDIENAVPCISSAEHIRLLGSAHLQSVSPGVGGLSSLLTNFEVGEPSSVLSNFEFGEPSSVRSNSEVGEPSSVPSNFEVGEPSHVPESSGVGELSAMQDLSEVGEPSYVPEPYYLDGILLKQLEAFLNSSPPHPENVNGEMLDSAILHEDAIQAPDLDFENVCSDLVDLSAQPCPQPTDGIALCDIMDSEYELHTALAEFADEQYMALSDIGFAGEGNAAELVTPGDYCYPFSYDPSSHGLNNISVDTVMDTYMASQS